jgi:hypothetical protein
MLLHSLARRRDDLLAVTRGFGFDEKLEKLVDGRRVCLSVAEASDGDALTILRLEVRVASRDAPALRIRRLSVRRALAVLLGLTREATTFGDRALDDRALLETNERVRVRAAVQAGLGAVVLDALGAWPEAELAAARGEVVLAFEAREGVLAKAIELATRAASALEAARIKPVEKDAAVRCGFCHDEMRAENDRSVRCDRCGATVHAACWETHEGCPALGCSGAAR